MPRYIVSVEVDNCADRKEACAIAAKFIDPEHEWHGLCTVNVLEVCQDCYKVKSSCECTGEDKDE